MNETKRIIINGKVTNYTIDTQGEVKNINTGLVLSQHFANGYKKVGLSIDKKTKNYLVHRLLAIAFIPNPKRRKQINHKDLNRSNNSLENLEWTNQSENMIHAFVLNNVKEIVNKGVSEWNQGNKKYRAVISIKNKVKTIGYFKTFVEAMVAYVHAHLTKYKIPPRSTYICPDTGFKWVMGEPCKQETTLLPIRFTEYKEF